MHVLYRLLPAAVLLCLTWATAHASLGSYAFIDGTGSPYELSGAATTIFHGEDECNGRNIDDIASRAAEIGFDFRFDGVDYSKVSISANGLIGLFRDWGSTTVSSCWTNLLTSTTGGCSGDYAMTLDSIPQITAYWDDMRVPSSCNDDGFDGAIRYELIGAAPYRVFVIEYRDIEFDYYEYHYATIQVRLFETSNQIEFWYGGFGEDYFSDGGSIGLAQIDGTSFQSVTPGAPATSSSTVVNDRVNPLEIAPNTLYTFAPCEILTLGDRSQGGTATMANGDTLLRDIAVQVGSVGSFEPFSLSLGAGPCGDKSFRLEVIGAGATDYTISPTSGAISAGSTIVPTITYAPDCPGSRPASLRMTMSDGTERTFALMPSALPQTIWTADMSQGATAAIASGDTLFNGISIDRGTSVTWTPITVTNTNTDPTAPSAPVTFTLIDPSGQYEISTTGATLAGDESLTPSITFTPTGVSFQEATLIVGTACDTRTYLLRAFSAAPGGILLSGGIAIDSTTALFVNSNSCVGSDRAVVPITLTNTGTGDFMITGVSFFRTDTTIRQGTSPFPMLRDDRGRPVESSEYQLVLNPGSGPLSQDEALALPFVVPQGQSREIFAVFNSSIPGRRYVRAYVQTNGENLADLDADGVMTEGLQSFNLVARGIGSSLAASTTGRAIRPVVLPATKVDDTSTVSFTVANAGACDLLIRRDRLSIFSGDVNEFKLVEVLPSTQFDAATNSYRIAPGASDRITVRFTPSRSGTRLATILLLTNDSTLGIPGVTERGSYYVDVHGFGRAGLDASSLVMSPVLVGSSTTGVATLENSSTASVEVTQVTIVGDDAAQFTASTTKPWPATPFRVLPGAKLELGVDFTPVGLAGMRRAILEVITSTNDTIRVGISGEAGVTQLVVAPTALFSNVVLPPGGYIRQTVTITNAGTFPVALQKPVITGTDAANYTVGALPRLTLAPGQTEYLEVTFQPQGQGASSATLEIPTSIGTQTVMLGGESLSANDDTDPDNAVNRGDDRGQAAGIGVTGARVALAIDAIRPNPASAGAELGFTLGTAGTVSVSLYDANGRSVAVLADGYRAAGRHTLRIDTDGLALGVYHVRIGAAGTITSTTLTVAR